MSFGLPVAALAALLFGTADFMGGFAARRAPALLVTLVVSVAGALPVIALGWWVHGSPTVADLAWGALGGLSGAAGVTLLYHVLARGPVGVVAPISAVCGVSVPVVVGMLLGERPTLGASLGIALAVVAVVLVNAGGPATAAAGEARPRPPVLLAVLSGLGLGGFLVFIARVHESAGLAPLLAARAAATVMVSIAMLVRRESFRLPPGARTIATAGALVDGLANVLYLLVVRSHAVSVVATLVSLAPALTVLLGRLVLREKFHRRQGFGLALAAVAVVLLTTS